MKKNSLLLGLAALLLSISILAGCRPGAASPGQNAPTPSAPMAAVSQPTQTSAVEAGSQELLALLEQRAAAVNSADQKLYLSTVLPSDAVLQTEERNLIRAASGLGITDYALNAGNIEQQSEGLAALLEQSYTVGGQKRSASFTAVFQIENGKLYYAGPKFLLKEGEHARVYYSQADEDLANQLLEAETQTLGQMMNLLDFTPNGYITIKLFDDQQVFLQSVKLDLPEWVGGWHEYGESIKSFTGAYGSNAANYKHMLNHESSHRMVSELSNDNASYWLQEGLAGVFENWLDNPSEPWLSAAEAMMEYTPYAKHKTIDLEKIGTDDSSAVMLYYASSKAYAAFLMDQYGWGKMREALEYMKKFELIPVTAAEKIQETNERTGEAVKAVFGLDDSNMQAGFEQWLADLRK